MKTYTKEEQKANRIKWAEALESGKYKQGTGRLKRGDSFCCLGVACDLAGVEWTNQGTCYVDGVQIIGDLTGAHRVINMIGLSDHSDSYAGGKSLTVLNDSGATFSEIAAVIRDEPEGLFV